MQQTRKNVICSVLALLLALTALTALFYNVMYTTSNTLIEWAENGFSMLDFRSDMISYQAEESGLLTAIGTFCLLQLLFSFFSLLFSILTLIMPSKAYKFPRTIFTCINELFLLLYAILGILAMTNSAFDDTMTAAYIPLLYGTVLLFAYLYCTKKLPEQQNA